MEQIQHWFTYIEPCTKMKSIRNFSTLPVWLLTFELKVVLGNVSFDKHKSCIIYWINFRSLKFEEKQGYQQNFVHRLQFYCIITDKLDHSDSMPIIMISRHFSNLKVIPVHHGIVLKQPVGKQCIILKCKVQQPFISDKVYIYLKDWDGDEFCTHHIQRSYCTCTDVQRSRNCVLVDCNISLLMYCLHLSPDTSYLLGHEEQLRPALIIQNWKISIMCKGYANLLCIKPVKVGSLIPYLLKSTFHNSPKLSPWFFLKLCNFNIFKDMKSLKFLWSQNVQSLSTQCWF